MWVSPDTSKRLSLAAGVAGCALVIAAPASAHPLVRGVTGFPALMLHPILLTHQLLCLIAGCLLIGRTRPVRIWQAVYVFGLALVAAQVVRAQAPSVLLHYWIASLVALIASGIAAAAFARVPAMVGVPLVGLLGGIVGLDTAGEGPTFIDTAAAVVASLLTSALFLFPGGWLLARPMPFWADVIVRVAAAWIAAATLMVAAFALKG